MVDLKATLKEALAKAIDEENAAANKLAHAVLERDYGRAEPAPSWPEEITRQEQALLAKQRLVDLLKLALSRLPEAAQTY